MNIPYRTRCALKRWGRILLVLLAVALLCWLFWILWLQRFVVFTRDGGAKLDFSLSELSTGEPALQPQKEEVPIYYNEGDNAINTNKELQQLQGYYITAEDLQDIDTVLSQLKEQPKETPIMLEVKSIYGSFFYSSSVSTKRSSNINTEKMDELLAYLKKSGMYTIAVVPAMRDYEYGLHHVPDGLPTAGGYLWVDDDGCYWLNPSSEGTISYLVQIVTELKSLGFSEVVFSDFYFPKTDAIVFKSDKTEALTRAAQTLVTTCATDYFCVSFVGEDPFTLPEGRSRLYKKNAVAAELESIAQQSAVADPQTRLVFLTEIHDTRFDTYSVLRPLSAAH